MKFGDELKSTNTNNWLQSSVTYCVRKSVGEKSDDMSQIDTQPTKYSCTVHRTGTGTGNDGFLYITLYTVHTAQGHGTIFYRAGPSLGPGPGPVQCG